MSKSHSRLGIRASRAVPVVGCKKADEATMWIRRALRLPLLKLPNRLHKFKKKTPENGGPLFRRSSKATELKPMWLSGSTMPRKIRGSLSGDEEVGGERCGRRICRGRSQSRPKRLMQNSPRPRKTRRILVQQKSNSLSNSDAACWVS